MPNPSEPPSREPLIKAAGLTRLYRLGAGQVTGIHDVDLEVAGGAFVVLKGDSGSGKSTLLSLLGGLDRPTRGSLTVAGREIHRADMGRLTQYRREVVGMIFQSFNLLPTLTLLENVSLPALLARRPPVEVRKRAGELVAWLGLSDRRDHLPSQLSGGEMQRTAIARSLINDPAIVLADEPTGNLDSRNGAVVVDLLEELSRREGRTVVFATHSGIADRCATVQVRLKDGAVV